MVTSPGATLRHLAEVLDVEPLRAVAIDGLRAGGIEMEGEFPWRCPDGRVIHFEGALPASWVALERDGRGKYATETSLITDRRRWTQASGRWRQVWTDWDRWHDDRRGLIADVITAIAEADPGRAPAPRAPCRCHRCRRRR